MTYKVDARQMAVESEWMDFLIITPTGKWTETHQSEIMESKIDKEKIDKFRAKKGRLPKGIMEV